MAKWAKNRTALVLTRFDAEAFGLVLFALGIFLVATVFFPGKDAGFMTAAHQFLEYWLSWSMYVLPFIPTSYGLFIWFNCSKRTLTRWIVASVIIVASLLTIHEIVLPGQGGALVRFVIEPIRIVRLIPLVVSLLTLTVGLELLFKRPSLSMIQALFGIIRQWLSKLKTYGQSLIETRQDGQEIALARQQKRLALAGYARTLDAIRRVYPDHDGFKAQVLEVKRARRAIATQDIDELQFLERDLAYWYEVTNDFLKELTKELRQEIMQERSKELSAYTARLARIQSKKDELATKRPDTLVNAELEIIRVELIQGIEQLHARVEKLEQQRTAALTHLNMTDLAVLAQERKAHADRKKKWKSLLEEWNAWNKQASLYTGWPQLADAFDRAPNEAAHELAVALRDTATETLTKQDHWQKRLLDAQAELYAQAEKLVLQAEAKQIKLPTFNWELTEIKTDDTKTIQTPSVVDHQTQLINETLQQFKITAELDSSLSDSIKTCYTLISSKEAKRSSLKTIHQELEAALGIQGLHLQSVKGGNLILEIPYNKHDRIHFQDKVSAFQTQKPKPVLPLLLGQSTDGKTIVTDLAKIQHLLIAGVSGSGKSTCLHACIASLVYHASPENLRLLLIDSKKSEFAAYQSLPYLVQEVITHPADAVNALLKLVSYMEDRQQVIKESGAKNILHYNQKAAQEDALPYLVVVVDELAELMNKNAKEVESAITRLAAAARVTGIHLILSTQHVTAHVLSSLIKFNIPARIAFSVENTYDSRIILDVVGAEKLSQPGELLFMQPAHAKPIQIQGTYISSEEAAMMAAYSQQSIYDDVPR